MSRGRSVKALLTILLGIALLRTLTPTFSYEEVALPVPIDLSPRLQALFKKTKLVCFGRYALEIPVDAELTWGEIWFPSDITAIDGGWEAAQRELDHDLASIRKQNPTSEVVYNEEGPVKESRQIRYYESKHSKQYALLRFRTYISKGDLNFLLRGSLPHGMTEQEGIDRQAARAKSLRLRVPDEIPSEPGYCIPYGFMTDASYSDQEMVNVGIHLFGLPDVTLSISSNKNAYADLEPDDFENRARRELSLLNRIKQAQADQGPHYPKRTVLREGKRDVNHWHGEESLIVRADGTHDFEWALVGTPKDVANPSEFNVTMFTKVEHNIIGAAESSSLSDEEAVALWDKLLSGLKFRVRVPGAPRDSYYYPKE